MSKQLKEWTETEKAFWILEHGEPKFAWIFERNGDTVYRRPMAEPGTTLPPWMNAEREEISNRVVGKTIDKLLIDEYHNEYYD